MWSRLLLALAFLQACGKAPPPPLAETARPGRNAVVLTIIGTNDLHGRVESLPILSGYLRILRELRRGDGAVLLLDGGDMFQGTLESNLGEGAAVVRAYNALGYAAVTVGNHEFDFGPIGDDSTPRRPGDDPRGALKARAAEAKFPFLMANVVEASTGRPPAWPNLTPSALVEVAGLKVGVIGLTTMGTPHTTIAVNFAGLAMQPLAEAAIREARALRAKGAALVVVTAHAGSSCRSFDDPKDASVCDTRDEIFALAEALPPGTVDAIVGGHSHAGVAHFAHGIPVIESYSNGKAFGRIDLTVDPAAGRVVDVAIHPPRYLCERGDGPCRPEPYEGREVTPDPAVTELLRPDVERARVRREERLGVKVERAVWKKYDEESPEGNLFADLMRAARPAADVAIANGGGLRADLPSGDLTYGRLYEAFPFDNRFARVTLTGEVLAQLFAKNLARGSGILSVSGARVQAVCRGADLVVQLFRGDGRPIKAGDRLVLVTSDFLASGGDGTFGSDVEVVVEDALIREEMAALLKKKGGTLSGDDRRLYDPNAPRVAYPDGRPVRCAER
jgi:5'-nucleotidase